VARRQPDALPGEGAGRERRPHLVAPGGASSRPACSRTGPAP